MGNLRIFIAKSGMQLTNNSIFLKPGLFKVSINQMSQVFNLSRKHLFKITRIINLFQGSPRKELVRKFVSIHVTIVTRMTG
ncbi:hypothetical protein D4R47_03640 [archaeon]|nr:MAG: hypothetical protein D4R47_03640 [archaeon]